MSCARWYVGKVSDLETKLPLSLAAERVLVLHVELGARQALEPGVRGQRYVVPILGGRFVGAQPELHGEVLPGGADWQLLRADGVLEIDARYCLRVADGTLIHVRNRGLVVRPAASEPGQPPTAAYVRTVPVLEAPLASPHAWLNRVLLLGSLELQARDRVCVAMYRVG